MTNELIITRLFNAPREQAWKAWTDPELLMKWTGPKSFTTPFYQNDLRIGGKYLLCMQSESGEKFWSTGVYKEIIPPKKLVCSDSFADENGNAVSAAHYGMSVDFPLEMEITILLEENNDKTKMTLTHSGLPQGEIKELTRVSWNESFDKLDLLFLSE